MNEREREREREREVKLSSATYTTQKSILRSLHVADCCLYQVWQKVFYQTTPNEATTSSLACGQLKTDHMTVTRQPHDHEAFNSHG